jgi:DNA replication and repair protein RecF
MPCYSCPKWYDHRWRTGERRRFLNLALSQVIPRYGETLSHYTQALSQRNALLKQLGKMGGDASQLEFWDEQLALHGAQLIHARILAIKELEWLATQSHKQLTHGGGILRFTYLPAFDPLPAGGPVQPAD